MIPTSVFTEHTVTDEAKKTVHLKVKKTLMRGSKRHEDCQRCKIREWEIALLEQLDGESDEGVNSYFTQQTIRLLDEAGVSGEEGRMGRMKSEGKQREDERG